LIPVDTTVASATFAPSPIRWRALRVLLVLLLAPLCWGADVLAISSVPSAAAATAAIPISAIDEAPAARSASATTRRRANIVRRRRNRQFDSRSLGSPLTALLGLVPMNVRLMPPLWCGPPVLRL